MADRGYIGQLNPLAVGFVLMNSRSHDRGSSNVKMKSRNHRRCGKRIAMNKIARRSRKINGRSR